MRLLNRRQLPKPSSAIAVAALLAWTPVLADDASGKSTVGTSVMSRCSQTLAVAKGAGGVLFAVTCGIPIKTCKYICSESRRMTQTLHDDFTDEPDITASLLAGTFGIPYGVASGTVLGIVHGVEDGIKDGYDEPFSKKSIGLE